MLRAAMPRLIKSLTSAVAQLVLHSSGLTLLHPAQYNRYVDALQRFLEMLDEQQVRAQEIQQFDAAEKERKKQERADQEDEAILERARKNWKSSEERKALWGSSESPPAPTSNGELPLSKDKSAT
jgi:hypothetical protein